MALHGGRLGATGSFVDWSECPSLHLYDVACGTAIPNPVIIGSNVGLNLDVIFNDDANVVGNYIQVLFTAEGSDSPIPLYSQDFNSNNPGEYGAGDEYTDSIGWLVPSFAPIGHYHASITIHGPSKTTDNYACLVADFDISS